MTADQLPSPSFLRRLAALVYDLLPLAGLLMLAGGAAVLVRGEAVPPGDWSFRALLAAVTALFFTGSWSRGGQTLGMRAWRLKVECRDGSPLPFGRALARFAAGLLSAVPAGLGFAWMLVDRDRLTWHDRLAGTRVVLLPRRNRESPR